MTQNRINDFYYYWKQINRTIKYWKIRLEYTSAAYTTFFSCTLCSSWLPKFQSSFQNKFEYSRFFYLPMIENQKQKSVKDGIFVERQIFLCTSTRVSITFYTWGLLHERFQLNKYLGHEIFSTVVRNMCYNSPFSLCY